VTEIGRLLVIMGLILVFVGLLLMLAPRIPLIGRLPGDIVIQTDRITCFVPLASMILLSLLLTLILNLIARLLNRGG
jgi:hypothetical protein